MNSFFSQPRRRVSFDHLALLCAVAALSGCQRSTELPFIPKPDLVEAYPEVRKFLERKCVALSVSPESARAWGEYAMALDAHEFTAEAIICYRRAAQLNPRDSCWKYLLALKIRAESPEEAAMLLSELAEHSNVSIAMLLTYSDVLRDRNRPKAVMKCLEKAAQLYPTHPALLIRQAELALMAGDTTLALSYLASLPRQYAESHRLLKKSRRSNRRRS